MSCETIGYAWNSALYICYKLYTEPKIATKAKDQCTNDHPESRLLLVDSDAIFDFHLTIMGKNIFHLVDAYIVDIDKLHFSNAVVFVVIRVIFMNNEYMKNKHFNEKCG